MTNVSYTQRDLELSRKVYSFLLHDAKVLTTGPLTYKDVGEGVDEFYRTLSGALSVIQDRCRERDWPTLTVWVVRYDTRLPGLGCDVVERAQVEAIEKATQEVAWPEKPWW